VNVTGRTLVFGLVGHPVRHSLSPMMHGRLFESMGVDAVYVAFDVHPQRADRLADAIRTLDLRGVNLTVPFKGSILPDLDRVTRAAEEASAVNVVIQHEGFLTGYNTDGEGFCRAFEGKFGRVLGGRRALVVGAGGAGRAVAAGLADRGARSVTLLNRTAATAEAAVAHLQRYFPGTRFASAPLDADAFDRLARGADLVVNCTSGAGSAVVAGFRVDRLPASAIWCDINYWMDEPPALAACKARGLGVQDGLPMLVHQGALSFELFTGLPVDPVLIQADLG
jgi:shikimate dehydrogenase